MRQHHTIRLEGWLCLVAMLVTCSTTAAVSATHQGSDPNIVTLTTVHLEISDEALEWHYRITNRSDSDIWLYQGASHPRGDFDLYLAEDGETLIVRRHACFPTEDRSRDLLYDDVYSCLRSGQSRDESFLISLPVYWRSLYPTPGDQDRSLVVSLLVLEIGFHLGNLPETVLRSYEAYEPNGEFRKELVHHSMVDFVVGNEGFWGREGRLKVSRRIPTLGTGEKLRIAVASQTIPYVGFRRNLSAYPHWRALDGCERIDFAYRPSMLDYFYPDPREQTLFNPVEKQYLQSQRTFSLRDQEHIRAFINELRKGALGRVITPGPTAHVACYSDKDELASFILRGERGLDRDDGEAFKYELGLRTPRRVTSQIEPYELRVRCARNLRDLWYRLRSYHRVYTASSSNQEEGNRVVYPAAQTWSDDLTGTYDSMPKNTVARPFICPSVREGSGHYAMNPNCEPDSAGDMVLLFETKAGWNQHGGAELFAFDNHEPRGGCVLLNDGTVRFIRTDEELHALRWE